MRNVNRLPQPHVNKYEPESDSALSSWLLRSFIPADVFITRKENLK